MELPLKAFEWEVEGGSPGDGHIVVVAKTERKAKRLAEEKLGYRCPQRCGRVHPYKLKLSRRKPKVTVIDDAKVLYLDEGER